MCVYLAPRWRRRSPPFLLLIMQALALLAAADGRTIRRLKTDPESANVSNRKTGLVTTDKHQSTTVFIPRAWKSGSGSWLHDEKSVSFTNLVKTNAEPCSDDHSTMLTFSASSNSPTQNRNHIHKSYAFTKQTDDQYSHDLTSDKEEDPSIRSNALRTEQLSNDMTAPTKRHDGKVSSSVPSPAPSPTKTPANSIQETPLSFQAVLNTSFSSDSSKSNDKSESMTSFGSTKSAEALDNDNKSSSLTDQTRLLDQKIVVVIIGIVGTIAVLLVFASRQVLREMGDDIDAGLF